MGPAVQLLARFAVWLDPRATVPDRLGLLATLSDGLLDAVPVGPAESPGGERQPGAPRTGCVTGRRPFH